MEIEGLEVILMWLLFFLRGIENILWSILGLGDMDGQGSEFDGQASSCGILTASAATDGIPAHRAGSCELSWLVDRSKAICSGCFLKGNPRSTSSAIRIILDLITLRLNIDIGGATLGMHDGRLVVQVEREGRQSDVKENNTSRRSQRREGVERRAQRETR